MSEERQSEKQIIRQAEEHLLRGFLDWIILKRLGEEGQTGYDIVQYILKEHGILIASGTVYSRLYSMERDGLIEATTWNGIRTYKLNLKGLQTVRIISNSDAVKQFLNKILLVKHQLREPVLIS
jgi:DNA-binding PadR family transcriptional regulator